MNAKIFQASARVVWGWVFSEFSGGFHEKHRKLRRQKTVPLNREKVLLDDGTGKLLKESNLRLAIDEEDAEDGDAGADSLTLRG